MPWVYLQNWRSLLDKTSPSPFWIVEQSAPMAWPQYAHQTLWTCAGLLEFSTLRTLALKLDQHDWYEYTVYLPSQAAGEKRMCCTSELVSTWHTSQEGHPDWLKNMPAMHWYPGSSAFFKISCKCHCKTPGSQTVTGSLVISFLQVNHMFFSGRGPRHGVKVQTLV